MYATDTNTDAPDLLTADDVADLLGVSKRTLWRLTAAGTLPQPIRFNRKLVRWKGAAVRAWIESLVPAPKPPAEAA